MTKERIIDLFLVHRKKKREIAEMAGLGLYQVEYILKRENVKRPYNTIPKEKKDLVVRLFRWGYELDEIGHDLKISRAVIKDILKSEKNISKFV